MHLCSLLLVQSSHINLHLLIQLGIVFGLGQIGNVLPYSPLIKNSNSYI